MYSYRPKVNYKGKRYIQIALGLVALLIVGCTMLLNSPRVQQRVSVVLAAELENHIGTRVSLGGVKWLFPTDIVIDSLTIDDQEGEHLLTVDRLATKVEWIPLILKRQLSIRNIRLFNPNIHIYKSDASSDYNYQFLIDAFTSKEKKDKEGPSKLSMRINTLLIRHAHICHHNKSHCQSGKLQLDNLSIDDLSAQLSLKALSADSVSLVVRQLGFKEHSGLCIDNLYLHLVANRHGATLANFQLDMPHSSLQMDTIWLSYKLDEKSLTGSNTTESTRVSKNHPQIHLKGKVKPSYITPSDLESILPQTKGITERVNLTAEFMGSPSRINIKALDIHTEHRDFSLHANAKLTQSETTRDDISDTQTLQDLLLGTFSALDVDLHEITLTEEFWSTLAGQAPDIYKLIPEQFAHLGGITITGDLLHDKNKTSVDLRALTGAGNLNTHISLHNQEHYTGYIDGTNLNIAQIIPESPLTKTNIAVEAQGSIRKESRSFKEFYNSIEGTARATATRTHLLGYEYSEISLEGSYAPKHYETTLTFDDPNGALKLHASYDTKGRRPRYTATLRADSLNLHAMQLIDIHENTTFSTSLTADLHGADLDHIVGKIIIDSIAKHNATEDYLIRDIALYASDPSDKMLSLQADFMHATIRGAFTYRSLTNSLIEHLHHSLPSLCNKHSICHHPTDNLCLVNMGISDVTPLRELLLQPIDLFGKAQLDILINDPASELKLNASIPHIIYDGNTMKAISLDCHSLRQGLDLHAGATLYDDQDNAVTANIVTQAVDDKINLGGIWNSNPTGKFAGTLHAQADFSLDEQGNLITLIETDSTHATLNQSVWELAPLRLEMAPERIVINGLHFANDTTQHLSADGVIARHGADTLQVSFQDLDLGYLLSLVKLEGISFDGNVSGRAEIANLYTEQPHIEAAITAQDFVFCEGLLGDLNGRINWNQEASQLQFIADVWEDPRHTTVVDGRVDFAQDELWIDIAADSINVSFLNQLLKSFMNDIKGHAYGNLTVGGPLKAINLDGALLANVDFNLTPTDVRYHFCDSLRFSPDVIYFNGIETFDSREQKAIINGTVKHNAIKDFAVDLYVDAQNVLGIDLPDTGHDSFYTTIYGTGGVHITASPTEPLVIDIQAQSEKGSVFAINLAPENESQSEKFITFTDRGATRNTPTAATSGVKRRRRRATESVAPTLIKIRAQVTPDAMLKLVMDQAVDDHISISGSGDLQISAQGTDISLFGTYTADRGFYRLSLQDVIHKNFDVQPGSTVSFDGDYTDTRLNITARHTVNYVPLRDLSPEMTGNVHVNCLLHIGGTLNAPTLTFGLELPQGTEEEKAILQSYTNTEEQTNLQFIYLLGLGKFYTPDAASNTQGAANMESFISSTISGQINKLLSNIISNENWNFASNLRAENMMAGEAGANDNLNGENWENMEIEGILEGHLLDNRLLINGSFGYRDNPMYASNFIGDFDIRYRLTGGLSLKGYNKTNDRYFSRTSLTTQGLGLVFQRDFDRLLPRRKRKASVAQPSDTLTKDAPIIETTP